MLEDRGKIYSFNKLTALGFSVPPQAGPNYGSPRGFCGSLVLPCGRRTLGYQVQQTPRICGLSNQHRGQLCPSKKHSGFYPPTDTLLTAPVSKGPCPQLLCASWEFSHCVIAMFM